MRKINFVLFIVLIFSVTVSGVYAYNKSIPKNKVIEGKTDYMIDSQEPSNKVLNLNDGVKVNMRYMKTVLDESNKVKNVVFKDADGNIYSFDKSKEKLTSISFNENIISNKESISVNSQVAKEKAITKIKKYFDISKYSLEKHELVKKADMEYYNIEFNKKIAGIPVFGGIFAMATKNGDVISITEPVSESPVSDDQLKKLTENYLDKEEAKELLDNFVRTKISSNLGKFSSYHIDDMFLWFNKENKLVWQILVGITYINEDGVDIADGKSIIINANTREVAIEK